MRTILDTLQLVVAVFMCLCADVPSNPAAPETFPVVQGDVDDGDDDDDGAHSHHGHTRHGGRKR